MKFASRYDCRTDCEMSPEADVTVQMTLCHDFPSKPFDACAFNFSPSEVLEHDGILKLEAYSKIGTTVRAGFE